MTPRHAVECWIRQRKGIGGCWCDRIPSDRLVTLAEARKRPEWPVYEHRGPPYRTQGAA